MEGIFFSENNNTLPGNRTTNSILVITDILILLILVFSWGLFIWRACDGFETASQYIGRNLSEGVRGGTINAISSSIPELFTTGIALFVLGDQQTHY